jgi:hypothetical protein
VNDPDCTAFLQWALPQINLRWPGFRKVRRQVCKRLGELARAAGVRRVEPFHFSKRYSGEEERMFAEVMDAFCGRTGSGVL